VSLFARSVCDNLIGTPTRQQPYAHVYDVQAKIVARRPSASPWPCNSFHHNKTLVIPKVHFHKMPQFKAWTYTTPGYPSAVLFSDISLPPLSKNQIHIRIQASALNPVDIQLINLPIWYLPGLRYEKGIGEDFAGEVIGVGADVSKWKIGDQVWGFTISPGGKFGTVGEVMPLYTTKAIILPRKEGLKATEAASLPLVFLTAYTALVYYAQIQDPPIEGAQKRILVLGGSTGVGIYALQIAAKRLGCHIVTTASTRNIDFVKSLGANEVIDYTHTSVLKGALTYLPDGGYDAIIDLVGGMELLPHLNTLLKPEAAYVTIVGDKTSRNKLGGAFIYPFFPRMVLRTVAGYLGYSRKYYCINLHAKEEYLEGNPTSQLARYGGLI